MTRVKTKEFNKGSLGQEGSTEVYLDEGPIRVHLDKRVQRKGCSERLPGHGNAQRLVVPSDRAYNAVVSTRGER